jgi:hypothetical protein
MNFILNKCALVLILLLTAASSTFPASAQINTAPAPAQGTPCDRSCLTGFVDQYLAALVAHDPRRLPLAEDAIFTENAVRLNLGQGLWSTTTGLGSFKIYAADPYSNQAGFIGVVMENGAPKILALRLQIKNSKIKEIETFVARNILDRDFPASLGTREAKPIWAEALPPSESVSRTEMIRAANQYFEGVEQNTGEIVPFDQSCNRTENGLQTTNNPALTPPGGNAGGVNFGAMGCKEQFNSGSINQWTMPERHFWMVDEQRGIVFGVFMFTVSGKPNPTSPGGLTTRQPEPWTRPVAEMFKIKSGHIYEIEALVGTQLAYGTSSGW